MYFINILFLTQFLIIFSPYYVILSIVSLITTTHTAYDPGILKTFMSLQGKKITKKLRNIKYINLPSSTPILIHLPSCLPGGSIFSQNILIQNALFYSSICNFIPSLLPSRRLYIIKCTSLYF